MLISLLAAELAYGDLPLLDRCDFSLSAGERVGLIGRNGTGKSSLLKVLAGLQNLDDGQVLKRDPLKVVMVEQEPELGAADTLQESLVARAGEHFHLEDRERWAQLAKLQSFATQLGVDLTRAPADLSGGERKRAALALALSLAPDLLLLDEPTNHLDIDAIETLENLLQKGPNLLVITHDRRFLDRVVTRVIELDRGQLRSYPGNFSAYERLKAQQLEAEQVINRKFDKFWAQEEVWIRKGVEARRTRNEGRVKRLEGLRRERDARREQMGQVRMQIDSTERSGKRVAELIDVSKGFARPLIENFSCLIQRGDRVGFIGPNGAGKSTLLKLILGQIKPDSGSVLLGSKLQPAYFDQMRAQLNPQASVADTISPGSEWIEVNGQRKHVMSYLGDFLFSARRAASPVSSLSGGERNRLLLARLFAQPANLLVLDEPTNDLDMESLELLEASLQDYNGTLLLVSHDRSFLDAVVTQVIAPVSGTHWRADVGGYSDWDARRKSEAAAADKSPANKTADQKSEKSSPEERLAAPRAEIKAKLSYKEQRELDAMPGEIAKLETELKQLQSLMQDPNYFKRSPTELKQNQERVDEIEMLLLEKLERWEALEKR